MDTSGVLTMIQAKAGQCILENKMTFNSIDDYEMYMEQVNDQQWEEEAMNADRAEQERQFNEMMREMDNELYKLTGIKQKKDGLNTFRPDYYKWHDMEVIEAVEKILTTEEYIGFLKGTDLVYRLRAGKKPDNPVEQDIKKALQFEEFYRKFEIDNTPTS